MPGVGLGPQPKWATTRMASGTAKKFEDRGLRIGDRESNLQFVDPPLPLLITPSSVFDPRSSILNPPCLRLYERGFPDQTARPVTGMRTLRGGWSLVSRMIMPSSGKAARLGGTFT